MLSFSSNEIKRQNSVSNELINAFQKAYDKADSELDQILAQKELNLEKAMGAVRIDKIEKTLENGRFNQTENKIEAAFSHL